MCKNSLSWLRPYASIINLRKSVCSSINPSVLLEKSPLKITHSRSLIEWSGLLKGVAFFVIVHTEFNESTCFTYVFAYVAFFAFYWIDDIGWIAVVVVRPHGYVGCWYFQLGRVWIMLQIWHLDFKHFLLHFFYNFLDKLSRFDNLPDHSILVTLDAIALYSSIPHCDGICSCEKISW